MAELKVRYIMIGGFLGAGKTTAMGRLAQYLTDKGSKVGLITNDQAGGLVDTRILRAKGFATEEIAGGCFCCRFPSLVEAAGKLNDSTRPDVFLAEPVGSCTDLVATVSYPLRRIYGADYTIAPLSVLVDPQRARRIFGLAAGSNFSSKVVYIFKKQLEEADLIVINKTDTLQADELKELVAKLEAEYPQSRVLPVSSKTGEGLEEWFKMLTENEQSHRKTMGIDYDIYADGEALLGWLNATVNVDSNDEFDAGELLLNLAATIQQRLVQAKAEVAHFKMTFSPTDSLSGELASINLVRTDHKPEPGMELDEPATTGDLIINLRAEASPESLWEMVDSSLKELAGKSVGLKLRVDHEEHFRPGRPTPTHRDN